MSRAPLRCLAAAAALWLVAPVAVLGQQMTEEDLVQHLDTLMPLLQEARERAREARQAYLVARESKIPTETLQIGLIRVIVVPGQQEAARDVVGGIWERDYASWLDESPSLTAGSMFFEWSSDRTDYRSATQDVWRVRGSRWRTRAYMEEGVRQVLSESLKQDLISTELGRSWIVSAVKPAAATDLYRRVAAIPSKAVRACLSGDDAACLLSFGLEGRDVPLRDLYTPPELALLARENDARFRSAADSETLGRCRTGDNAACEDLLDDHWEMATTPLGRLWAVPFDGDLRGSLLWYAVQRGGAGAWSRLLGQAGASPLAALEAASGLNGPELVAGWRDSVLEGRSEHRAGLGSLTLTSLLWILLFIALAARSTRWRLG